MKILFLAYHPLVMTNPQTHLEATGVKDWFIPWPGLLFFRGQQDPKYYAMILNMQSPTGLFVVHEYEPSKTFGWMEPHVWKWING
jgi:hypothetical protein